jgi:hypothetical protein
MTAAALTAVLALAQWRFGVLAPFEPFEPFEPFRLFGLFAASRLRAP